MVIAFQADNPGFWIMHCHNEHHLLDGMAVVVQEYSSDQQWAPPPGINLHGSFRWTVDAYNQTLGSGQTCMSENVPPTATGAIVTEESCITSPAGFGITIAIIIVLFIVVLVLIVVIILVCVYGKKSEQAAPITTPTKEEIPTADCMSLIATEQL